MTRYSKAHSLLDARERFAAVVAALTASGSIFAALLLALLDTSPAVWLPPSPDLSELLAQCERIVARDVREQCKRDLVSARLEAQRHPVRMTQR